MNWYLKVLRNYVNFSGRARRREYWYFVLVSLLISIAIAIVQRIVLGDSTALTTLYGLAVLLPSVAVGVRRLHDIGRTGWWLLIGLIPIVGAIVLLIFAVQDSQPGSNQYGPNPKHELLP